MWGEYPEAQFQQDLLDINNDRHDARVAYLEGRIDGFKLRDALNALDRLETWVTLTYRRLKAQERKIREEMARRKWHAERAPELWVDIPELEFRTALGTNCGPVVWTLGEGEKRIFKRLDA